MENNVIYKYKKKERKFIMIKIIDGDLFESKADIIAHQVNKKGAFNSGVAKQVREKYPEVFETYSRSYKSFNLGDVQYVETKDGKTIANMFGQNNYGYDGKQYTSYEAIDGCLKGLHAYCKHYNKTVALPYGLASVRGGAKWDKVYAMIEEIFDDMDVEIWRLDKG
jgi:O-acetyl-ADP-ribose deacetylase (regulator of RNase III)